MKTIKTLSTDMVKAILPGETKKFFLEDKNGIYSAKANISRINDIYGEKVGLRWTYTTIMDENIMTITCNRL